jgi:1-deoxy-D-xylulose-5-phosphate reductoisomerase
MDTNYKSISILGSTGSIGVQTLEVLDEIAPDMRIEFLTANKNIELLDAQVKKHKPRGVAIADASAYKEFRKTSAYKGEILCGADGVKQAAAASGCDLAISALVGFSGVEPAYEAINSGKDVALANKESLVAAGSIINNIAKLKNKSIIAVDSEHSAVLQSIVGESKEDIEKIILTASGGPFWDLPLSEFSEITVERALKHPNWSMGAKVTIDSSTMMNKGFEIIEAVWLFDIDHARIDVLVHPQSIVHSMAQFRDGSVKAQLGLPDMKLPIAYALTNPRRAKLGDERLDLAQIVNLSFFKPDYDKFPCLSFAFTALEMGGNAGAILNAANEVGVSLFLEKKIRYVDVPAIIEYCFENMKHIANPSLDEIINTDLETKKLASVRFDKE